jgi:hypothetical protein
MGRGTRVAAWAQVLLLLSSLLGPSGGWRLWTSSEVGGPASNTSEPSASLSRRDGPLARRGHSLNMYGHKVVLFGGKGRDTNALHVPKSFELVEVNGTLQFASYDQQSVPKGSRQASALVDPDPFLDECLAPLAAGQPADAGCSFGSAEARERDNYIPVSTYFNDVWWYDLDCARFADAGCEFEGWHVVDPGTQYGGCKMVAGLEECSHPYERYAHSAQVVGDQFLLVFGGFSQLCGDYCDDAWVFVLPRAGEPVFSVSADYAAIPPDDRYPSRWVQLNQTSSAGKRWKSASVLLADSTLMLFGGHRLWQGFSQDNSRANRYESTAELPRGGFLSDLWRWELAPCLLTAAELAQHGLSARGALYRARCRARWEQVAPKENCSSLALMPDGSLRSGFTWEQREERLCHTVWPAARSGHAMVALRGQLYLFGGYRTPYPYPHSTAAGSGPGTAQSSFTVPRFRPYPDYEYYLSDFWRYDLAGGYWFPVEAPAAGGGAASRTGAAPPAPAARTEHSLVATRDGMLIMYGGYRPNHQLPELWYFNESSRRWLHKSEFVWPIFPPNCTAGGKVQASPTLGTVLDGRHGRAAAPVVFNLARKQEPGWDGCRDRADGRQDLPLRLQYQQPLQRSHHAVAWSETFQTMLLFGGQAADREREEQILSSFPVLEQGDLWAYNVNQCINNCSGHGDCSYGFCRCHSGYYGINCGNVSCPGDFCYYDEVSMQEKCQHCCHAPYRHTDADTYVPDLGKLSCSREDLGEQNGVCDGSGHCLCAPPFLGLDCSIKDCPVTAKGRCSGAGWCSEEYPVSRCMCEPGYTGFACENVECLNNCSYPNGACNLTKGECACDMWQNPYNRSRDWRRWEGMDCSFLIPFADATRPARPGSALLLAAAALLLAGRR